MTTALAKWLVDYDSQKSLGSRFRAKRIVLLLEMIAAVCRQKGSVQIIDVGGVEQYWRMVPDRFLEEHKVTVTVVNLPGSRLPADHGPFRFVQADGCDLAGFADASFDIAHSNSVVEHVGDWNRMVAFAGEMGRVAPRIFVQTPSYWFPIEPHCMVPLFHWLPKPLRIRLVLRFQLGNWKRAGSVDEAVRVVESARLLDRKMFQELFRGAELRTERFCGLPKSFIALKR